MRLCRLVLSLAGPALLIDLNKKLNYSILATGGRTIERESERGIGGSWKRSD